MQIVYLHITTCVHGAVYRVPRAGTLGAGDARVYVSGGAEHQGPEGGGTVCVVFHADKAADAAAAPPSRC
jgi:hypothetical protein